MNAPVRLPQPVSTQSPQEAMIAAFLTPRDEMEMAVRVDLVTKRDAAMVGMHRTDSDSAAAILDEVVRVATGAIFAQVPTSRLIRINATLQLAMHTARAFDRMQRDG